MLGAKQILSISPPYTEEKKNNAMLKTIQVEGHA